MTPENATKPKLSIDDLDEFDCKSPNPKVAPSKNGSKKTTGSSPLRSSPKQRRRRRLVKFNKVVHNRRIPHLNDLSKKQIVATWIQPEEYLDIQERCKVTVRKMMKGSLSKKAGLDNGKYCARGLEGKTREGSCERREHKLDSIAAVIDEQTMQWEEDVLDEESIMEVYSFFSIPCAEAAYNVALEDAEAAYEYQHSIGTTSADPEKEKDSADAQHETTSAPVSPMEEDASGGVVDRLKDVLFHRSSKAALLHDIESVVYNESAMERRRKAYEKPSGSSVLASQLRQYFSTQTPTSSSTSTGGDEHDIPSLASSQFSESSAEPEDGDVGSSSSGVAEATIKGPASSDVFTTQLHNHFHARRKRQALLKSIESGYFEKEETAIETVAASTSTVASIATSHVAAISGTLGTMLKDVFSAQSQRRAMVNELKTQIVK
jgi:hypothetical protein